MSRDHVIHVVPALFDRDCGLLGGAERYAFELARHMADLVPTKLVTFGDRAHAETFGNLRVRVIGDPYYVRGLRTNPIAAALLTEIRQADIVHCHQQHVVSSSLTALACRALGRRICVSDLGGGGWDISAYVSTDRWFQAHLHISEYSLRVAGHTGRSWAHVIWGGVDAVKFSPDDSIRCSGPVLYVGRLLPHKGVDNLIDAIPEETMLDIVGTVPDATYLAYLQSRAAGKNVRFRHDCDDGELVRAYQRASCVVLPSVYRDYRGTVTAIPELLGQTLLEAMSCAVPVICTDVASLPEVVEDGVCGLVVPPNDPQALRIALLRVLTNRQDALRMGDAGRARVLARFTWQAVVDRCFRAYGVTPSGRTLVA